jgi:hypothetical protein
MEYGKFGFGRGGCKLNKDTVPVTFIGLWNLIFSTFYPL